MSGSNEQGGNTLEQINEQKVQEILSSYANQPVYLHVETTNGAYAAHFDQRVFNAGTFLRNIQVTYEHAQLKGGDKDPYRVGLKLKDNGWTYVQGLTHYEINERGEFLLAGFNYEGQLAAALEISTQPFHV
ncbi:MULTISPECIES: YojF family protein [Staphylococcus]|uniref:YojF family protein n=1 Tax=Staphylococcus hsinchuensis TaxID=3051183 RepID=A0ABZ3EES9_9STAP|nr:MULTISPECIES: YojF family protein [unclassified Staphylococcus]